MDGLAKRKTSSTTSSKPLGCREIEAGDALLLIRGTEDAEDAKRGGVADNRFIARGVRGVSEISSNAGNSGVAVSE